jgi:putative DNA primase/helicase
VTAVAADESQAIPKELRTLAHAVTNPLTGTPLLQDHFAQSRALVLSAFTAAGMLDEQGRPLCPTGVHVRHEWIQDADGQDVRLELPPTYAVVDRRGVPSCTAYPPCDAGSIYVALGMSEEQRRGVMLEAAFAVSAPRSTDVLDAAWHELNSHDTTDRGHGERFARWAGNRARWVATDATAERGGHWLVYDDASGILVPDQEAARHLVADMGQRLSFIAHEALTNTTDPTDAAKALLRGRAKAGQSLSNTAPAKNALAWARDGLAVQTHELDADAWLLCTPNGVVDLRRGWVSLHRADLLMTKQTAARWEPDARAPRWEAFLAEMIPDPEVRAFLQETVGYAMTGDVSAALLVVLYGDGENGKSVFTEVVRRVLGGYAMEGNPELLGAKAKGAVPTDVMDLAGQRFVPLNELASGTRLDEATVKTLVSAEQINARRMFQDFQRFTPTHHLFLKTNHLPEVEGRDEGIWRRLCVVPFEQRPARKDPDLTERIVAHEAEGVQAWAWAGLQRVVARGVAFEIPEAIRAAREAHRASQLSDVEAFLLDQAFHYPEALTPTSEVQRAYADWARQHGAEGPRTSQSFGRRLAMALDSLGWTKGNAPQVFRADSSQQSRYSGLGIKGAASI